MMGCGLEAEECITELDDHCKLGVPQPLMIHCFLCVHLTLSGDVGYTTAPPRGSGERLKTQEQVSQTLDDHLLRVHHCLLRTNRETEESDRYNQDGGKEKALLTALPENTLSLEG